MSGKPIAQAFIELRSHDPEAVSALEVMRARLEAGQGLSGLRRFRVFEVRGTARSAAGQRTSRRREPPIQPPHTLASTHHIAHNSTRQRPPSQSH